MFTLPRLFAEQQDNPDFVAEPRYWVQEFDTLDEQKSKPEKPVYSVVGVTSRLAARQWDRGWLLGWRDICRSTDERTLISAIFPRAAAPDATLLMIPTRGSYAHLLANLCSFALDYVVRQKSGGTHLKYFTVRQLPVLPPGEYQAAVPWLGNNNPAIWIRYRVLELSYTTWDMEPLARDLGDGGPPFRWDEGRRTLIRTELDAAYFHIYGLERDEVEHVMHSFDALRRREEKSQNFGEFRTKRLIFERYDAMAEAVRVGVPYQTVLDPPPGHGPRHSAR